MDEKPSAILRIDTDALSARDKFAFWAEEMGTKRGFTSYDSPERATFRQELSIVDANGVTFMRAKGSPLDVYRGMPSRIQEAADYPFHLLLKLNNGFTTSEQRGRSATIGVNDMLIIDSNEAMRLCSHHGTDAWIIGLSQSLVTRWLPDAKNAAAVALKGDKGWTSVLAGYLRAMSLEHLNAAASPFERELVGEHVLSMLSMALSQNKLAHDAEEVSARDRALHARMRMWIRDHYADPEISAAKLAADFNVSVRYVHKAFASAGHGMTFLGAVQHERMEAAMRMLRTSGISNTQVSQIAYSCGFTDPAYFGLVFRKHRGCSPGAFAKMHGLLGPSLDLPAAAAAPPGLVLLR
ncbi:helix-turn-helix transcriptional regulator [Variovorax paradoxus]|uniref:helix-turn-helix transcriptional regulator n=1 Tax=Variovorax paradoxus TaxID=34073 RepID=UPI0024816E9F|nr:AraC family transcriptional regulator [Variovorax paradoxus]WGT65311.1 AraC family transcriptional regulator [Variovorax paradoxus]